MNIVTMSGRNTYCLPGDRMAGMRIKSISFDSADAEAIAKNPTAFTQWLLDDVLTRFGPPSLIEHAAEAPALTIGQAFKEVGGWMQGGELGYPSFGSMDALRIYTNKMVRAALNAGKPDDIYNGMEAQLARVEAMIRDPDIHHTARPHLNTAARAQRHAICAIATANRIEREPAPHKYGMFNGEPVAVPPGFELVPEDEYPAHTHLRLYVRNRQLSNWGAYSFNDLAGTHQARVRGGVGPDGKPNDVWVIAYAQKVPA